MQRVELDRLHAALDRRLAQIAALDVEAAGFVSHLKLPHYVDFQAELELIRKLRKPAEGQSHE